MSDDFQQPFIQNSTCLFFTYSLLINHSVRIDFIFHPYYVEYFVCYAVPSLHFSLDRMLFNFV
jgi:hypothetical protein